MCDYYHRQIANENCSTLFSASSGRCFGRFINRRPGSPCRTRKERRLRGTKLAAAQVFSTTAIPRTRIEDIDRVALQTRITDGTIVLTDKRTNRTLTVSEIKGSDSAIIVCALEYPEVNPGAPTPKIKKRRILIFVLFLFPSTSTISSFSSSIHNLPDRSLSISCRSITITSYSYNYRRSGQSFCS
ncbi:hypothetical protein Pst134EA_007014 [Puccinia striiformis f. sp. tritici]|uniref:hypothetical protein n=1 Tax=Puccinia striiformis f. sp. tritici TaxID=168172 RepID=UPI002007D28B|nr:hypothetical protein Pst134EA_007014 [Puccinia striiformis f. sp. tritici]KAH9469736.1 hypothetical protein Pst134EA_007014 [Puccinia striiformis f. sp. tritici]